MVASLQSKVISQASGDNVRQGAGFDIRRLRPFVIIGVGMLLALAVFVLLDQLEQVLVPGSRALPLHFVHLARGFLATCGGMIFIWWIMRAKEAELVQLRDHFSDQLAIRTVELERTNESLLGEVLQRKEAQEKLRRLLGQLARSNAQLKQFARIASHDLQEPLRVIEGYGKLLSRRYKGRLDSKADEFIEAMVDGAIRMGRLIDGILAHSRAQAPSSPFTMTDCSAVLDEVIENLSVCIEESNVQITRAVLPSLMADRSQLVQLFQNLISNAIKIRGLAPPLIHIWAESKAAGWTFFVRDKGIGIEACYAEQVFEMFKRLHAGKSYPGSGIGLAICKEIVEHHGGKIWFESEPNQGSTFMFTIPIESSKEGT